MLLYHISQKENKFTECVICKLRISQNIGSLTAGIKTRGWQLGSEEETKFTYNSKGVFLTLGMIMFSTINNGKYTPSSKKYPCLTLSQAISQSFNQSNNQLIIHQSIYQSDNLVSQSVRQSIKQSVSYQ